MKCNLFFFFRYSIYNTYTNQIYFIYALKSEKKTIIKINNGNQMNTCASIPLYIAMYTLHFYIPLHYHYHMHIVLAHCKRSTQKPDNTTNISNKTRYKWLFLKVVLCSTIKAYVSGTPTQTNFGQFWVF